MKSRLRHQVDEVRETRRGRKYDRLLLKGGDFSNSVMISII